MRPPERSPRERRLRADRLRQAILHNLFPIGGTITLLVAALVALFAR